MIQVTIDGKKYEYPENCSYYEIAKDFEKTMEGKAACFIGYDGNDPVAFAQCGLRYDYVEGTDSSPVGYLEGMRLINC